MVRFLFLVRPIYKAIFKGEEMKANSENMLLLKTTLVPCQGIQFTDIFLGRAGSSSRMKKVHPWGGGGQSFVPQARHSAWQREISR